MSSKETPVLSVERWLPRLAGPWNDHRHHVGPLMAPWTEKITFPDSQAATKSYGWNEGEFWWQVCWSFVVCSWSSCIILIVGELSSSDQVVHQTVSTELCPWLLGTLTWKLELHLVILISTKKTLMKCGREIKYYCSLAQIQATLCSFICIFGRQCS